MSQSDFVKSSKQEKEENKISNLTSVDHWLLFIFGILSFVSASIWHYFFC